jgi:NTP pyrophosphatase (non-canonical NTP hydrolase)
MSNYDCNQDVHLSFNEYQKKAASTAIYKDGNEGRELFYVALGLAGEAGEFAGEVSKLIRDDKGQLTLERANKLVSEVGDVMWFLAQTCTELGVTMEQVAQANLDKLASRKARGVLTGSGGDR